MTRQSRKKVACYNFTINRVHDVIGLLKVSSYLVGYSDLLAVGFESKANIGSEHLQGFIKLNLDTKYTKFFKELKSFLKQNFSSACLYTTPVPNEQDSEKCIKYACKQKIYFLKKHNSTYLSKDLTKSVKKIIMLLKK